MGRPADAQTSRWWVDRGGRLTAAVVLTGAALAWAAMLARPAMRMPGMAMGGGSAMNGSMMPAAAWTFSDAAAFLGAWAVMMAAMMLPSATPMIALFGLITRSRAPHDAPARIAGFALPYLALWALTGVPVYAASAWLSHLASLHHSLHRVAPYAVAGVLLAAGGYQFSQLKRVCLKHCTNPLSFLLHNWQAGTVGAVRMGARHAVYCLGCCGMLMVVLVAAGAMGLAWVLLIAAAVLMEKLAPQRVPAAAMTGVILFALGAAVLIDPALAGRLAG